MGSKGGENNIGGKERITQKRGDEKSLESQIKRGGGKSKDMMEGEGEEKNNPGRKTLRWKEVKE